MILERLKDIYRRRREIEAIELLQHPESYPGLAPWHEPDTHISFVCLPAFQAYSVWTLQHGAKLCQVRRVEWDHATDYGLGDTVPDAAPTTFGADAQLPVIPVQELLNDLATISLPPFLPVSSTLGLDGVSCAVLFGNDWRSACLSWWNEPPEEWQPLVLCYQRAVALFELHLPVSTARNLRGRVEV